MNYIQNSTRNQHTRRNTYNTKTFDVIWMVNGQCREVLMRNTLRPIALWEKKKKENSTHTTGKVLVVENGTYK